LSHNLDIEVNRVWKYSSETLYILKTRDNEKV
jgi:hypothetical protein